MSQVKPSRGGKVEGKVLERCAEGWGKRRLVGLGARCVCREVSTVGTMK